MRRKHKLVIRGWILRHVDELVEEYNKMAGFEIDREEIDS